MNKYLEKIALTRLVKEIGSGALKVTKKKLNNLVDVGSLRSVKTYADGLKKGNTDIAKKMHVGMKQAVTPGEKYLTNWGGGAVTQPRLTNKGELTPHILLNNKHEYGKLHPLNNGLITRHELHEARELKEYSKKKTPTFTQERTPEFKAQIRHSSMSGKEVYKGLSKGFPASAFIKGKDMVQLSGMHLSPRVLGRDSNVMRNIPHLHADRSRQPHMLNIRKIGTGEASIISNLTGKKFGRDKLTEKALSKLHENKGVSRSEMPNVVGENPGINRFFWHKKD